MCVHTSVHLAPSPRRLVERAPPTLLPRLERRISLVGQPRLSSPPPVAPSLSPPPTVNPSAGLCPLTSPPSHCPSPSQPIDFFPFRFPASRPLKPLAAPYHGGVYHWQRHCGRSRWPAASGAVHLPRGDCGEDTGGDTLSGCGCGQRGAAAGRAGFGQGGGGACGH